MRRPRGCETGPRLLWAFRRSFQRRVSCRVTDTAGFMSAAKFSRSDNDPPPVLITPRTTPYINILSGPNFIAEIVSVISSCSLGGTDIYTRRTHLTRIALRTHPSLYDISKRRFSQCKICRHTRQSFDRDSDICGYPAFSERLL